MTTANPLVPKCPKCGHIFETKKRKRRRGIKSQEIYNLVVKFSRHGMQPRDIMKELNNKGHVITRQRIWQIQQEYAEEVAIHVSNKPKEQWIGEAMSNYDEMLVECFDLLKDANDIENERERIKLKGMAIEKLRMAQQGLDNMLKSAGIYNETSYRVNVNIEQSPEWQELEGLIIEFLKKKNITPGEFVEFVDERKKPGKKKMNKHLEESDAIDIEYEEV